MPIPPSTSRRPGRRVNAAARSAVLLAVMLPLSACSGFLYGQTGSVMSGYTVDHMVPYMMSSADVDMACETGVSMGSFLMSFEQVTHSPDRAALVTLMSAGMCAEGRAWDAELARLRAVKAGDASAAQDARIVEQRAHALAAKRYHEAYERAARAFGDIGNQKCRKLSHSDQLLYLLGLSSGLLAVMHDFASGGQVGVPAGIPRDVARGSKCLSDDAWWGAPSALRAAIWTSVPGSAPKGADPWKTLADAAKKGDAAGVRLASAFEVQAAASAGKEDLVRKVVADEAAALAAKPAAKPYRLLDRYAFLIILHESDKIWTRETGHRTPTGRFGTFEAKKQKPVDDSLLEGLGP